MEGRSTAPTCSSAIRSWLHLIDTPTHNYGGSEAGFIDARTNDVIDPVDLFAPLSADSSQVAAIVAAQRGADYVLFGPPGTGKSQTIANAITNCLAHGTVLFVSQKTAALVVRQRMNAIGLGNYCLEVHSTKAQTRTLGNEAADGAHSTNPAVVPFCVGAHHRRAYRLILLIRAIPSRNAIRACSYRGKTAALTASGAESGWPESNGGCGSYSMAS